jgi:hypothetical protein
MAYTLVDSLVRASIPAIVLTVFAIARRYLPARSAKEFGTGYSIDELSARFAFTQWLVGAGMLTVGAVIAWGVHALLVSLNQVFVSSEGSSDFVLLPQTAIWWFLPGFAAITLAWEATLGTWSLMGNKNEVALYNYWTTAKAGFDSTRVLRIMAVPILLPIAILTTLALPEHAVLQKEEIRARGYGFSGARTYCYADARRITVIDGFRQRDGKLVKRAGIVLDFSDGRRWSSAAISNFEPNVDQELLRYIQSKTGLEPQYVEAEPDIPRADQR